MRGPQYGGQTPMTLGMVPPGLSSGVHIPPRLALAPLQNLPPISRERQYVSMAIPPFPSLAHPAAMYRQPSLQSSNESGTEESATYRNQAAMLNNPGLQPSTRPPALMPSPILSAVGLPVPIRPPAPAPPSPILTAVGLHSQRPISQRAQLQAMFAGHPNFSRGATQMSQSQFSPIPQRRRLDQVEEHQPDHMELDTPVPTLPSSHEVTQPSTAAPPYLLSNLTSPQSSTTSPPYFRFNPTHPCKLDLHYMRALTRYNPHTVPRQKAKQYEACATALKTSPETAQFFENLSDHPHSKTLSTRYIALKTWLEHDDWVPGDDLTEIEDSELQSLLLDLMEDERAATDTRLQAKEKKDSVHKQAIVAAELRENIAIGQTPAQTPPATESSRTMSGVPPPATDSSRTMSGVPPPATDSSRTMSGVPDTLQVDKGRKRARTRDDEFMERLSTDLHQLNQIAIDAQKNQAENMTRLLDADLSLGKSRFEFNSKIKLREVDLAEKRFEHDVQVGDRSAQQMEAIKEQVASIDHRQVESIEVIDRKQAERFSELKDWLQGILPQEPSKAPHASGSS